MVNEGDTKVVGDVEFTWYGSSGETTTPHWRGPWITLWKTNELPKAVAAIHTFIKELKTRIRKAENAGVPKSFVCQVVGPRVKNWRYPELRLPWSTVAEQAYVYLTNHSYVKSLESWAGWDEWLQKLIHSV